MLTFDRVGGLLRHILTTAGGYLAAKGYVDEGTANELVGAVMVILGAIWSWGAKKPAQARP